MNIQVYDVSMEIAKIKMEVKKNMFSKSAQKITVKACLANNLGDCMKEEDGER